MLQTQILSDTVVLDHSQAEADRPIWQALADAIPNSGAEHPLPLLPSAFFHLNLPWLLPAAAVLRCVGHREEDAGTMKGYVP
jgi:hypothetical protein